jgi:CRP-like cAMP-binding protein
MMQPDDPRLEQMVKQIDIFNGLSPGDVYRIYAKGMTHMAMKDQMIFHKNTVGSNMFVVLGGKVGVYDGEKKIAELGTGHSFGEMSLLTGEPRSATVKALEDTMLFVLDERIFQKLLTKRVAVQMLMNISRMLGSKLKNANMVIRELEGR